MADPWAQFADAPAADPWAGFADAPAAEKSWTERIGEKLVSRDGSKGGSYSTGILTSIKDSITHAGEGPADWRQTGREILPLVRAKLVETVAGLQAGAGYSDEYKAGKLAIAREAQQETADIQTSRPRTFWERAAQGAAVSTAVSAPGMAAGIAARSPAVAATAAGLITEGQQYAELRNAGLPEAQARRHAAIQGIIEGGTEFLPARELFKVGSPLFKRAVNFLVAEMPGETYATVGQALDAHIARLPRDATAQDVIDGLKQGFAQIPETVATVALGAPSQVAVGHVATAARARGQRARAPADSAVDNPAPQPPEAPPVPPPAEPPVEPPQSPPAPPAGEPAPMPPESAPPAAPQPPVAEGPQEAPPSIATGPVQEPTPATPAEQSAPAAAGPVATPQVAEPPTAETPPAAKFSRRVFRGHGRADRGAAYNGTEVPILGDGRYYAFDRESATKYGPNVEERTLELRNPLVINSDQEWRDLTDEAGWKFPNPRGQQPDAVRQQVNRLQDLVRQRGHDGIVVEFDPRYSGDILPDGRAIKTLRNVFGTPQAVEFAPVVKEPSVAAARTPRRSIAEEVERADPSYRVAAGKLTRFVQSVQGNEPGHTSVEVIAPVSRAKRRDIQQRTGIDVGEQAREMVRATTVQHVRKRHPNVTEADWRVLPWLTANYDNVVLLKQEPGDQGPRMAFVATDPNTGYAYVAEALAGRQYGQRLAIVSFFKDHPNSVRSYLKTNAAGKKEEVGGRSDESMLPRGPQTLTSKNGSVSPPTEDSVRPPEGEEQVSPDEGESDISRAQPGVQKMPGAAYVPLYQAGQPVPQQPQATALGTAAAGTQRTLDVPKEPIRREHIMEIFQRSFGLKVYQGKPFKVKKALGYFRISNREIRIKAKNDLEVTAHEVFHWLDRTYPSIRKLYHERRFHGELIGVSYDATKLHEGFAEFGRLFMTQEPEAVARLPNFYDAFVAEAKQLGIYSKLARVQDGMHQWYAQGAELRAQSKIGASPPPLRQRFEMLTNGLVDRAIQKALDSKHAAKVVERELSGTIAADAVASPYKSMRLLGGVRSTIHSFLNFGTLDWTPNGDLAFTGKGLLQIFEPVGDVFDDTMAYFVGRRALELRKYGKENLFRDDEILAMLERGRKSPKRKEIEKAFLDYQEFNRRLLDFAQHSGIVSGETRKVWETMYANYVPFYRVSEDLGGPEVSRAPGAVFKRLTGGTANLRDTLDNITLNTAMVVNAAMRNMAKRQLFTAIENSTRGQKYAVKIPAGTKVVNVQVEQVERLLRNMVTEAKAAAQDPNAAPAVKMAYLQLSQALSLAGSSGALQSMQDQATFFTQGHPPTIPDKDSVLIDGKRVWYQIGDPLLWNMLSDLNFHKPLGLAERIGGLSKRVLTRGVTLTPEFQVANITRDTVNAFTLSLGGQRPFVDTLAAMREIWTQSDDFKLFMANGGGFGQAVSDETRALKVRAEKLMSAKGVSIKAVLDTPEKLVEFWDTWGQSFELATRLAEFKRVRAKGATAREAAYQGREISTDFAMRGTSTTMRFLSTTVPFFNARVQGLYRLEREIAERDGRQTFLNGERRNVFLVRASMLTALSVLAYLHIKDDDDYQQLPDPVKDLNWAFRSPTGKGLILIPKPYETGMVFGSAPIRLWERMVGQQPKKFREAMEFMFLQAFALDPTPQLVKPLVDVYWRNQYWNGMPIVPRSLENVEPREQYRATTPQTVIATAQAFGVSPLRLEALWNGYLGTLGSYAIMASDALVAPNPAFGEAPEKTLASYPLFRRFLRQPPYASTSFEADFYELAKETERVVATARKLQSEARGDDLAAYLSEDDKAVLFGMAGVSSRVGTRAREINSAINMLRRDPSLSAAQKRQQIDELQTEQNRLFQEAVNAMTTEQLAVYRDRLEKAP